MKDYLTVLRDRITAHPPDLGDADSVLALLYEAYSEIDLWRTIRSRQDFTSCTS